MLYSALELVRDCRCEAGCPACVGPVGEIEADTKQATLVLLAALVGQGEYSGGG